MNADKQRSSLGSSAFICVHLRPVMLWLLHGQDDGSAIMAESDSVLYWVVIEGRNFKTRTPIATQRFRPYSSEEEAERALPEFLPWDTSEHVYSVCVEAVPATEAGAAAKEVDQ